MSPSPRPAPSRIRRKTKVWSGLLAVAAAVAASAAAPGIVASASSPEAPAAVTATSSGGIGIFPDTLRPQTSSDPDRDSVELGVRFTPQRSGSVTALQYYQGPETGDVEHATLWSGSGKKLASVSFDATERVGWRTVALATPARLEGGRDYVVSYHAPHGHYAVTESGLSDAHSRNGFSLDRNAGVYAYADRPVMPRRTFRGSNYMADVVFRPGTAAAPAPAGPTPGQAPRPSSSAPRPSSSAPAPTSAPTPSRTAIPTRAPGPTAAPGGAPAPSRTAAPTKAPAPTTATPTSAPAPAGGTKVLGRSFPNADTTGVPAGTKLTDYTGPCTVSAPNTVIENKTVNCYLRITGKNVAIKNSVINGAIYSNQGSFTVTDSDIRLSAMEDTGVGEANFTLTRVEITGSRRSVNCASNCTVEDSYIHAQGKDSSGEAHQSGIRMGAHSVIRHNTFTCDAPASPPAGGCSAALTGYGDFAAVEYNTIDNNLILEGTGGYCAYGGSSTGKPYSGDTNHVSFTNNVWQRGKTGVCGIWGPIVSFDQSRPGNVWSGNSYDDGTAIRP